ncbi:MAG: AlbA family DNA-binding domain-containing protein [Pyrinomonadaceae bacterium]
MPDSLDDIVFMPESQSCEWKRSLSLQREGLESLCGMINANPAQGSVIFGKSPDGQIVGVEPGNLDRAQQSISQTTRLKFEPSVQCTYEVFERNGISVLVISAVRNRAVPYHEFDGRAFIREGTVTRQLNLSEKQALQRQRNRDLHMGPWKCDGCGSWVGTFSQIVLTDDGARKTYSCRCGGEFWPAA